MFRITEVSDGYGGWSYQSAEPIEGSQPQGAAEDRALALQTAQVDLERAQQQLADERDPVRRQQLQLQVQQAQFALDQARAKGPLDLQTAQLAYDRRPARPTSRPPTRPRGRAAGWPWSRRGWAWTWPSRGWPGATRPRSCPRDPTSPVITTRDPNTGAISTQPNPAYQGPTFTDAGGAVQRPGAPAAAGGPHRARPAAGAAAPGGHLRGGRGAPVPGLVRAARGDAPGRLPHRRRGGPAQGAAGDRGPAAGRERPGGGTQPASASSWATPPGRTPAAAWTALAAEIRTPQFLDAVGARRGQHERRARTPRAAEAAAALPRGRRSAPTPSTRPSWRGARSRTSTRSPRQPPSGRWRRSARPSPPGSGPPLHPLSLRPHAGRAS